MSRKKTKNQKKHFKRRLYQRYSIALHNHMYVTIIKRIQNNDEIYVGKISNRLTLWKIKLENKLIPVLYDKNRKTLVTALPQNCYQLNNFYPQVS